MKNSTLLHIDFSFDEQRLGGSAFAQSLGKIGSDVPTVKSAEYFADAFNAVQTLVEKELVLAGHDISAGGMIVTLLEMCFANVNGGLNIDLSQLVGDDIVKILFSENPGLILQIDNKNLDAVTTILEGEGVGYAVIGRPSEDRNITLKLADKKFSIDINKMRDLWFRTSYLLDRKQSMNGCADKRYENYSEQPLNLKFNYNFTGKLADYGLNPDRRESTGIKAAIIREKGTNGEREMAYTLWLAGFDVKALPPWRRTTRMRAS